MSAFGTETCGTEMYGKGVKAVTILREGQVSSFHLTFINTQIQYILSKSSILFMKKSWPNYFYSSIIKK